MIFRSLLVSFTLCASVMAQPVLRVSKVVSKKGEGVEQMVYAYVSSDGEEYSETLLVEKAAIVTEADIQEATMGFGEERNIMVQLSKAGGKKIGDATGNLQPGADRLAVIVDGKIMSAPVVMSKLGRTVMLSGLDKLDDKELQDLLKRLNGKSAPK